MNQADNNSSGKRRGRQRSRAVDDAILTAALEILAEEGYGEFTMNAVIARAGVSSATLYRRFTTADELVLAALSSMQPVPAAIDTGALESDLDAFVDYLADALQGLEHIAAAEASGPRASEELRDKVGEMFTLPRVAMLREILERAKERGELGSVPPVGQCWIHIISPLHHRLYLRGEPLSRQFLAGTKTVVAAGIRALANT